MLAVAEQAAPTAGNMWSMAWWTTPTSHPLMQILHTRFQGRRWISHAEAVMLPGYLRENEMSSVNVTYVAATTRSFHGNCQGSRDS